VVAARVLEAGGAGDVEVKALRSSLPDHYDATRRCVFLGEANYAGTDLAAAAVAAHEAAHALQHRDSFTPLSLRLSALKLSQVASGLVLLASAAGAAAHWFPLSYGLAFTGLAWAAILAFNLGTLPVEFDASRRARALLKAQRLPPDRAGGEELGRLLWAAALLGVGAVAGSLPFLAYSLLPFMGKKR
jgi:Zn-dependent membrane protease YugP